MDAINDFFASETMVLECEDCQSHFSASVPINFPALCQKRCDKCQADYIEERNEKRDREALNARMLASGIDQSYREYDREKDPKNLNDWLIARASKSACIRGKYQIGKTHMAAHVGLKLVALGKKVIMIRCGDWCRQVAAMMGRDMDEAEAMIARAKRADLLILDDLGKERLTDRGGEVLFSVIDHREVARKATWITTNLNGDELAKKLGDDRGPAIIARIRRAYDLWPPPKTA